LATNAGGKHGGEHGGAGGHSPLEQFEIKELIPINIGGYDISFTNSSMVMVIAVLLVISLMTIGTRKRALVPGRWQSIAEMCFEFCANLLRDTVGTEGRKYFPFIFTLFMFILFGNMLGMVPYSFTFTSHIIVTFVMAMVVFTGVTILGFVKHGTHFFSFFVPPGVSLIMWPLMIPIEIISYLSRPISLAVRLFANMTAGHTMLKVFASFVPALGAAGIAPLAFATALTGLEVLIAFLQAYVFTVLTCLYISDAVHLH
jgi:F-type H+-transporting ATPase subunit a